MFRQASWFFVVLFGLALAGATVMNVVLINQARQALDEGILGTQSQGSPALHHLALVIPDTTDSFFEGLVEGVSDQASESGVAIQVFRYRENLPAEAEAYFQLCLTSHLDGIILFVGPDDRLASRLAQAEAENVVLIPVGTQAPSDPHEGFIGSSSLLQGVESGNQLARLRGRNARVGVLLPAEGLDDPREDPVYRGVAAALESYPGARIVRAARVGPGPLSGEEAASALLRADPSINVLVCATAPITEGAAQVVVDQGRVGQVVIIGTDESPTIDRLVDKGVIAASVVRDSRKMGAVALESFLLARNGVPFRLAIEVGFKVRGSRVVVP